MFNISSYLGKVNSLLTHSVLNKEVVIEIVKEEVGIDIHSTDVDIRGGVIYFSVSPLYKNEIFLKRDLILQELRRQIPQTPITEIR